MQPGSVQRHGKMEFQAGKVVFVLIECEFFHVVEVLAGIIKPACLKTEAHAVGEAVLQQQTAGKGKGILGIGLTGSPGFGSLTKIVAAAVPDRKTEEADSLACLNLKTPVPEKQKPYFIVEGKKAAFKGCAWLEILVCL